MGGVLDDLFNSWNEALLDLNLSLCSNAEVLHKERLAGYLWNGALHPALAGHHCVPQHQAPAQRLKHRTIHIDLLGFFFLPLLLLLLLLTHTHTHTANACTHTHAHTH